MTDPQTFLAQLTRPQLLVRAARYGLSHYNRDNSMRRMLPGEVAPPPGQAFEALKEREEAMELARREGGAAYSPARHVELLASLIDEARLASHRKAA